MDADCHRKPITEPRLYKSVHLLLVFVFGKQTDRPPTVVRDDKALSADIAAALGERKLSATVPGMEIWRSEKTDSEKRRG